MQHHLDVVVAGVLGEVEPERLQQPLVGPRRGVDGDQARGESTVRRAGGSASKRRHQSGKYER